MNVIFGPGNLAGDQNQTEDYILVDEIRDGVID